MSGELKMISMNEDVYVSIDSLSKYGDEMIKQFVEMSPQKKEQLNMNDDFLNGIEFFKQRLNERSQSFYIEVELVDLGIGNGLVKRLI